MCMYACTCVCTCTHTCMSASCMHAYMHLRTCMHVCVHACTCARMHAYIFVSQCKHVHVHPYTHVSMPARRHTSAYCKMPSGTCARVTVVRHIYFLTHISRDVSPGNRRGVCRRHSSWLRSPSPSSPKPILATAINPPSKYPRSKTSFPKPVFAKRQQSFVCNQIGCRPYI